MAQPKLSFAASILRRLARLRPGQGEMQVLIGTLLRRAGQHAESLRAFRPGGRLSPTRRSLESVLKRLAGALLFVASAGAAEPSRSAVPPARPPRGETAAAREQARLCERLSLAEGAAACRAALALGISPSRRAPLRQLLARHLVALERWDELVEHFREDVRHDPASAAAWLRLGSTLLFALDRRAEATRALETAVTLAPGDAEAQAALAVALAASGRLVEARAAFEEARRLDPAVLAGRPAATSVEEAAREGRPWP